MQALAADRAATDEATQLLVMGELAGVRWDLLADAAKGPSVWAAIARKMGPQALRMNLNTLLRHDVFNVVDRSADPTSVRLTDGAVNDNTSTKGVASAPIL